MVAREITKMYEEFLRGPASEVLDTLNARDQVKGEITLLIGKAGDAGTEAIVSSITVRQRVNEIMSAENLDEKTALKKVAKERGVRIPMREK